MAGKTKELRALTGLRGIAALVVALDHYGIRDYGHVFDFLIWNSAAVDLFFCLSGFTLCVAYRAAVARQLPVRTYIGARIARIYPLYVISIGILLAADGPKLFANSFSRGVEVRDFVQQMLMVNSWPFFGTGINWNFPAWSVSVEFFCYLLVFPVLFYAAPLLLRLSWWGRALLATAAMGVSAFVVVRYFDAGQLLFDRWPGVAFPPPRYFILVSRGILGMLAGWLAYVSYLSRDRFWRLAVRWAGLTTLAAIALQLGADLDIMNVQWMLLAFPALVLGFTEETSFPARLVASRPVHFLGEISYSIYLLHLPWFAFLANFLGVIDKDASHHPASFIVLVLGLVPVSALSYRFVEKPLRLLLRKAFDRRPDPGIVALRWALPVILGGVMLLEADLRGLLRPLRIFPVAVGEEIARDPTFARVACQGWSSPEDWGIWSVGHRSLLDVPLAEPAAGTKLALKGVFFVTDKHPNVTVHFSANGIPLETVTASLASSTIDQVLDLPPAVFAGSPRHLKLAISVDNPASPYSLGQSNDIRDLGFGLKSLMLVDGKGLP